MQKRFVSWAAVSSLPQAKKISLEDQLKTNLEHIQRWEGVLVEELVVPGESRSIVLYEDAARQMEAYARLRELINKRAFDVLVYLTPDRLGRKSSLIESLMGLCHEAGIVTYSTESPPASLEHEPNFHNKIVGAIESALAQEEVNKIRRRHQMGMYARVKDGNFPGLVPYGWRVDYIKDEDKDKPIQVVYIDEDAKATILVILELYLEKRMSARLIAAYLNEQGMTRAKGQKWKESAVTVVLGHVWRYAGYVELNKGGKGKRPYVRSKLKWPALISEEMAKAVTSERERRSSSKRAVGSPHLFSGLIWCKKCNRMMQANFDFRRKRHGQERGDRIEFYRCVTDHRKTHAKGQIMADLVLESVQAAILFVQSETNRQQVVAEYEDYSPPLHLAIRKLEGQLAKHQESIQRADDLYVRGKLSMERYERQIESLTKEELAIKVKIAKLMEALEEEAHNQGRMERLAELADGGMQMLTHLDVAEANAWFRRYIKIWIDNDEPERRIAIQYL